MIFPPLGRAVRQPPDTIQHPAGSDLKILIGKFVAEVQAGSSISPVISYYKLWLSV